MVYFSRRLKNLRFISRIVFKIYALFSALSLEFMLYFPQVIRKFIVKSPKIIIFLNSNIL